MEKLETILELFLITYNRKSHLINTLNSIFSQTSPIARLKITILDNKSTDGSTEIIEEYKKKYSNIIHIVNNRNIGGNANISKCFELANKKYFWILCDDDNYDWSHWSEVKENLLKNEYDAIVVSNYINPKENIAQLLCQMTFVPSSIYKTENLTDTVMQNAEYQISNLFPHLALTCKLINDNKKILITDNWIVKMVVNKEDSSYTRGMDNDKHPLMDCTTWSLGFLRTIQMINNKKNRDFIFYHLKMDDGEKMLLPKAFFKYNKTIGKDSNNNIYTYFSLIPNSCKIVFIYYWIKRNFQNCFFNLKNMIKKTFIGKCLLIIKHNIFDKEGIKNG